MVSKRLLMFGPLPIRILAGITFIARPIKPRIRIAEAKVGHHQWAICCFFYYCFIIRRIWIKRFKYHGGTITIPIPMTSIAIGIMEVIVDKSGSKESDKSITDFFGKRINEAFFSSLQTIAMASCLLARNLHFLLWFL
jgi:hypothetical protein